MRTPHIRLALKALLWQLAVWCLTALLLFAPAGTVAWPEGWTFLALFFGVVLGLSLWATWAAPDLLAERLTLFHTQQPLWDRWWLALFYLLSALWLPFIALDAIRWHWSQMPVVLQTTGLVLFVCSLVGIVATVRANRFLSPVIRSQAERDQAVISTGPYRYLRHPLYGAASLFYLGVPVFLGSWSGVLCAPIFIGLMAWRAIQEEQLLCQKLLGYKSYMQQVKTRFLPGIW
jgi:protein-S-isoprenylcysteine O-methyltransferase Ste14